MEPGNIIWWETKFRLGQSYNYFETQAYFYFFIKQIIPKVSKFFKPFESFASSLPHFAFPSGI